MVHANEIEWYLVATLSWNNQTLSWNSHRPPQAFQHLNLNTFSQLKQLLILSKDGRWTSHKFFVPPNTTYLAIWIEIKCYLYLTCPFLDIILYGSFHPSYNYSKKIIIFFSLESILPYISFSCGWINFQQWPPHVMTLRTYFKKTCV